MEKRGVSKKELAQRLNIRPTEISQRLKGTRNMTLRSLAAMLHQLDASVDLSLCIQGSEPARSNIRQTSQVSGNVGAQYTRRPPLRAISGAAA
ncbi:helix-turn-helix domain-containing protein [Rhodococcus sp. AD45-ID]|uniref:helix-turn-helix domain-containing protein n=1 Tax=Rhodococcus sp. AD45-ID TaxID=2127033 RepID=UPI0035C0D8D4